MIVDWTDEFDRRSPTPKSRSASSRRSRRAPASAQRPPGQAGRGIPHLKRIRQARCHEPWRAATPRPRRRRPDHLLAPRQRPSRARATGPTRSPSGTCSTPAPRRAERPSPMPSCARREAPMTEEVKFIRGNDRINQLAQRPDIADGVNRVRAEMAGRPHLRHGTSRPPASRRAHPGRARLPTRRHPGRHQPHRAAPRPAPVHPQLLPRSHRRPRQRHRHLRRRATRQPSTSKSTHALRRL